MLSGGLSDLLTRVDSTLTAPSRAYDTAVDEHNQNAEVLRGQIGSIVASITSATSDDQTQISQTVLARIRPLCGDNTNMGTLMGTIQEGMRNNASNPYRQLLIARAGTYLVSEEVSFGLGFQTTAERHFDAQRTIERLRQDTNSYSNPHRLHELLRAAQDQFEACTTFDVSRDQFPPFTDPAVFDALEILDLLQNRICAPISRAPVTLSSAEGQLGMPQTPIVIDSTAATLLGVFHNLEETLTSPSALSGNVGLARYDVCVSCDDRSGAGFEDNLMSFLHRGGAQDFPPNHIRNLLRSDPPVLEFATVVRNQGLPGADLEPSVELNFLFASEAIGTGPDYHRTLFVPGINVSPAGASSLRVDQIVGEQEFLGDLREALGVMILQAQLTDASEVFLVLDRGPIADALVSIQDDLHLAYNSGEVREHPYQEMARDGSFLMGDANEKVVFRINANGEPLARISEEEYREHCKAMTRRIWPEGELNAELL